MLEKCLFLYNIYEPNSTHFEQAYRAQGINEKQTIYRLHALLQTILFKQQQKCAISHKLGQCINNRNYPVSIETFDILTNNRMSVNYSQTMDDLIKNWSEKIFYFYNCAFQKPEPSEIPRVLCSWIKDNQYTGVTFNPFFSLQDLRQYKRAYEDVQRALNVEGLSVIENLDLPTAITDFGNAFMMMEALKKQNSPWIARYLTTHNLEQINECLNSIAIDESNIGRKIKALTENEEYKAKYNTAVAGDMNEFKKFLFSCLYFVIHSLKFISFQESFVEAQTNYTTDCESINNSLEKFKIFIQNQTPTVQWKLT